MSGGNSQPSPKRGGRPTTQQVRERRIAEILARLEDSDLLAAEAALRILEDPAASPSVKVQSGQLLSQIKERVAAARTATANSEPGDDEAPLSAEEFLIDLGRRARALEAHFGKPLIELLPGLGADERVTRPGLVLLDGERRG